MHFLGHIEAPERVLAAADALIRLRPNADPWGRDIIEALQAGLPVVTFGLYKGFVEDGVNGVNEDEYDPQKIAERLVQLLTDTDKRARISVANRQKASALFDPASHAAQIATLFNTTIDSAPLHRASSSR